jgi:hypothetical protein
MADTNNTNAQQPNNPDVPQLIQRMEDLTVAVRELIQRQQQQQDRQVDAAGPAEIGNDVLLALINSHNPYTSNNPGDMSIFVNNPNPANQNSNDAVNLELEVDGPYSMAMEWNFKGSPQKINKTIRIKYRYRARNLDLPTRPLVEPRHWVTAYLLIGYEDGGA